LGERATTRVGQDALVVVIVQVHNADDGTRVVTCELKFA
jgi:hypothetical protein